jgi:hypothetical protein
MAKQKNNRYQRAATKKAMLNQLSSRLDTKGDLKHSALETGKDLLIGVLGGGLVAALIGKPAFVIGLGITGVGHYAGNTLASTFGLGMMAGGNIISGTVSGIDGLDGAKERVTAFKDSMLQRTYMDKIIKKKADTVSGTIGELQYFDYGQMTGATDNPELYGDMGALNDIEQRIEDAGMARLQGTGMGAMQDMEGLGDKDLDGLGYPDVAEYNF